jgi:hypothetical protein
LVESTANIKEERKWGIVRIPIINLKLEEKLPEKYNLRKIEFSLSSSYMTWMEIDDKLYKYTEKGWALVDALEKTATDNIKRRKAVAIKGTGEDVGDGGINQGEVGNDRRRASGNLNNNRYENVERNIHIEDRGHSVNDNRDRGRREERQSSYDRYNDRSRVSMIRVGGNNTTRRPLPSVPSVENLMDLDQRQAYREGYGNNKQPVANYLTEKEIQILNKAAEFGFNCEVVQKKVPEPQEGVYHHLKRENNLNKGYYDSQGLSSRVNIRPTFERNPDNFRPDYANEQREPRRSTGNWETELHRARLLDVLPPMVSRFQRDRHYYTELKEEERDATYEDMKYINKGEPQKPGAWTKVTDLEKNVDRSEEQWQTIQNVRSTIGGASHLYEEPIIKKELLVKKELLDWVYKPLERFRQASNEERARTPVEEEAERVWTSEMARNMDALSLTGARAKMPQESMLSQLKRKKVNQQKQEEEQKRADLMTQEQERSRVVIQLQMAHINTLNQSINSQVQSRESPEDDSELYTYKNILCSTHPALVGGTYQNRLEIMSNVQDELEQVVRRKSNRLQKLQAEKHDLQALSRRERGNLE